MAKTRLDVSIVERGLAETRERARALILAGDVIVAGNVARRAAEMIGPDVVVEVRRELPFVSRGGFKLQHALAAFRLDIADQAVIDIGASTGGFTDCLLQSGARRVYAIDVGYGQLHWKLRTDSRVVVVDRTNIRYLTSLPEVADGATIDVSFISLALVLEPVSRLLSDTGWIVALVKPQFEAGRGQVSKGGVIRDPAIHRAVIDKVLASASSIGLQSHAVTRSPIIGPAGNREFLILLRRGAAVDRDGLAPAIDDAVRSEA